MPYFQPLRGLLNRIWKYDVAKIETLSTCMMQKQSKGHTFVLVSLLRQWWEQGYSIYLRMILNSYSIVIRKKTSNNRISIEKESNINRISEVGSTNLKRCNYLSKTTWDKNENPDLYKHYKGPYSLFKKKQFRLSSQTRKNPIFAHHFSM